MYNIDMENVRKRYISEKANKYVRDYIKQHGYTLGTIRDNNIVSNPVATHPDIFMCRLGIDDNAPVCFAQNDEIGPGYPAEVPFNAACTGKFFIHNVKYTNYRLLVAAKEMGMTVIDVKQGYTKCSTVVVDENSIITYDCGIAAECRKYKDLNVLVISPEHVILDGYNRGFIGGTAGRIDNEIFFNGDLSAHPDFESIVDFIEARGLKCTWFTGFPLTDIGSVI